LSAALARLGVKAFVASNDLNARAASTGSPNAQVES
jgi:hypothetical protein